MSHTTGPETPVALGGFLKMPDVAVVFLGFSFAVLLIIRGTDTTTAIAQSALAIASWLAVLFVGRGLRNVAQGRTFVRKFAGVEDVNITMKAVQCAIEDQADVMRRLIERRERQWPDFPPDDRPAGWPGEPEKR
uniref:hypothetical protein n=1 Tax=Amycolatopsis sp. CA-082387 TaxID=3239918 RepID=UPI003F497D46